MRPTPEYVLAKFTEFNNQFFEGKLPPLPIKVGMARGRFGSFSWRKKKGESLQCCLRISARFDLPEEECENTIIHEMIHYYILITGMGDSSAHGPHFKLIMDNINRISGRHITISYRPTEAEQKTDELARPNYICVTSLERGELGITVCAKTRIFTINASFKSSSAVRQVSWYWSSSPWFGRYPRVRIPKIYPLAREDFERAFADAIPCEIKGKVFRICR